MVNMHVPRCENSGDHTACPNNAISKLTPLKAKKISNRHFIRYLGTSGGLVYQKSITFLLCFFPAEKRINYRQQIYTNSNGTYQKTAYT